MRLIASILFALVTAHCGGRTALDNGALVDAGGDEAACPLGQIACASGCPGGPMGVSCQVGRVCVPPPCLPDLTTCPAGEELCATGCPERQNFTPPVCMVGPCPGTGCVHGGSED